MRRPACPRHSFDPQNRIAWDFGSQPVPAVSLLRHRESGDTHRWIGRATEGLLTRLQRPLQCGPDRNFWNVSQSRSSPRVPTSAPALHPFPCPACLPSLPWLSCLPALVHAQNLSLRTSRPSIPTGAPKPSSSSNRRSSTWQAWPTMRNTARRLMPASYRSRLRKSRVRADSRPPTCLRFAIRPIFKSKSNCLSRARSGIRKCIVALWSCCSTSCGSTRQNSRRTIPDINRFAS